MKPTETENVKGIIKNFLIQLKELFGASMPTTDDIQLESNTEETVISEEVANNDESKSFNSIEIPTIEEEAIVTETIVEDDVVEEASTVVEPIQLSSEELESIKKEYSLQLSAKPQIEQSQKSLVKTAFRKQNRLL